MAVSGSIPDYRNTVFEFTDLTRIHGNPTAENLLTLQKELRANAASVYSDLGGGRHGHLYLVLTQEQYGILEPTHPFIRPLHPGTLTIPNGTTGPQIQALRDSHKESLRIFKEVNSVEAALIQQINKAIDAPYLDAVRDRITNSLRGPISTILDHLKNTYGRVTVTQLDNAEDELRRFQWSLQEPIDTVFNKVNNFCDYAELAGVRYNQPQIIQKAYVIIHRTNRFQRALTEWTRKPTNEQQSWDNFKSHFRQAYNEFQAVSNLSIEEAQEEQRNANLVAQVIEGVQSTLHSETASQDTTNNSIREEVSNVANQVQQHANTNQQLIQQLNDMQTLVHQLCQLIPTNGNAPPPMGLPNQPYPPSNTNFQPPQHQSPRLPFVRQPGNQRGGRQNNRRSTNRNRACNHYCWTHGAGAHPSHLCNTPAQGHQARATFRNTMGGNQSGVITPTTSNSNPTPAPYNTQPT